MVELSQAGSSNTSKRFSRIKGQIILDSMMPGKSIVIKFTNNKAPLYSRIPGGMDGKIYPDQPQ
jgi:hypothetical protein